MKTPDLPVAKATKHLLKYKDTLSKMTSGRLVLLPRRMYDIRVECNHKLILKSNVHV